MARSVAVLTTCIPERFDFLRENLASVRNQTVPPRQHLVSVDYDRIGHHRNANRLGWAADADRLLWLADDDYLYPQALERLASVEADIVYSDLDVAGIDWHPGRHDFDPDMLEYHNFIPATSLISAELWKSLGGFPEEYCEDWAFYKKALSVGAKFVRIPEKLWCYRFHGGNMNQVKP